MKVRSLLSVLATVTLLLPVACTKAPQPGATGETLPPAMMAQIDATSLEGYWICRSDDVEVHITQVGERSVGSGSYKDSSGKMYPAGKFRNIRYLGGNRWDCEEWIQSPGQLYDPMRGRWEPAVIEMLNQNRFKCGNTEYHRV